MNIKTSIIEFSKTVENIFKNNIKNKLNITKLTKYKLKNILFNKVILKNEIKKILI